MENGDESVAEFVVTEKKSVEDGVYGEKAEERVLESADEMKDAEDEVFEEAIGTEDHFPEERGKAELLNSSAVSDGIGNDGPVAEDLGEVEDCSNAGQEAEDFREALDNQDEVSFVDGEQKGEKLTVEENNVDMVVPDKVDEGGTENGGENHEVKGEELVLDDGDIVEAEENLKTDGATEKLGNGDANMKNGDKMHENVLSFVKDESKLLASPADNKNGDSETSVFNAESDDSKTVVSLDSSAGVLLEPQHENNDVLVEKLANGNIVEKSEKDWEIEGATVMLDSSDGSNQGEIGERALAAMEEQDKSDVEVKDTALELKCNDETDDVKEISADQSVSLEQRLALEAESLSSLQKTGDEGNQKIQAVETGLKVEADKGGNAQMSDQKTTHAAAEGLEKTEKNQEDKRGAKVDGVDETQHASVCSSRKAEETEKEEDKHPVGKKSHEVDREREIQQSPLPSHTKSNNSATLPARPAGLGRAAPLLEPAQRAVQQPRVNGSVSPSQAQQIEDSANGEGEEGDETREKLQMIRVKFLRLAHRLGQTPHNVVVAQVLYRLGLAEQLRGRNGGRVGAFSFDRASAMAEQLEAAGNEPLDFSCTIMVLGKSGVGKSATINSIFDEVKFGTDAFQMGTRKVQDVVGTVHGIKVRVIDTPGLLPSWSDQRQNEKILHSVKRFIKKTPPDIVLYLDRLDMQSRDFSDMPLLRTITEIFGPSIWFNAIVVLTHAASAPPDGPNGTASSYDMFVTQRSHVVQQAIRQAAGDMRLMNPVSLVENHSACRTNRAGQRVLPNGQVWKPHLLLLSFASKILAEANALLKLQDTPPGRPFVTRSRTPPLPFLLSSLLQSRSQVKLPEEQFEDDDGFDDDLEESSDSDDESEYDELPPFKRLTKAELERLSKGQRKSYFDELEYREKLFMKKQLKEEKRQRKMMKNRAAAAKDLPSEYSESTEEESGGPASVPVPMPDLALPASFDSDNPTHRYRYLDNSNQWLVRPVLETHGWDHDVGYEGLNIERLFVVKDKIPISFSGQVSKDKKDASVQMELASSIKHGEGKATSLGFDMQTVGKDLAYTLRSETRFSNSKKNKAAAGLSVTLLGDALSAGLKVEDKLVANKRFRVVMTGGAMAGRGDIAYGGSLEAQLRDKDYPLGRSLSTLGLSVMDWHGDLALGCNIQSQVPVGRSSNLIARANLNNRGAGQINIRLNSSEQLQIALVALIPLLKKILGYPQMMQYGQ